MMTDKEWQEYEEIQLMPGLPFISTDTPDSKVIEQIVIAVCLTTIGIVIGVYS